MVGVNGFLLFLQISLFVSKLSVYSSKISKDECDKKRFIKKYVQPNLYVHYNMTEDLQCRTLKRCIELVKASIVYDMNDTEYMTIRSTQAGEKKDCWGYLLQLHSFESQRSMKLLHQRFYGFSKHDYKEALQFKWKITYGSKYMVRFIGFPYKYDIVTLDLYQMPKGPCELKAYLYADQYCRSGWKCFTGTGSLFELADGFCERNQDIDARNEDFNDRFLSSVEILSRNLVLKNDNIVKDNDPSLKWYIWLIVVGAVVTFIVAAIFVFCFYRKRSSTNSLLGVIERISMEENNNGTDEGQMSVIILHQPGCQELNPLIKTLESVIQELQIDVTSPFYGEEYSPESFHDILNRINNSTLVIIVCAYVPRTETLQTTQKYRWFIWTLKMVPNENSSRCKYILVYLENYDTAINKTIPINFLGMKSFKVPDQLEYFSKYVLTRSIKKEQNVLQTKKHFIKEACGLMKKQVKRIFAKKHKKCNVRDCEKGLLGEVDDDKTLFGSDLSATNHGFEMSESGSISHHIRSNIRNDVDHETDTVSDDVSVMTSFTLALCNRQLPQQQTRINRNVSLFQEKCNDAYDTQSVKDFRMLMKPINVQQLRRTYSYNLNTSL